jgi:hypothetical protein
MSNALLGAVVIAGIAVLAACTSPSNDTPVAADPTTGLTAWGDPDLEGVWASEKLSGGEASLIVAPIAGQLPSLTTEGQELADAAAMAFLSRPGSWLSNARRDSCVTRGAVARMLPGLSGGGFQILQSPDTVVIRPELIHEVRIIPIDGRRHVGENVRSYSGDSRGRWEGNTLVVETTNLLGKALVASNAPPTTDSTQLTERFARTDEGINYEVTIRDPKTYTGPFTLALSLVAEPVEQFSPYECHEDNRDLINVSRDQDRLPAPGPRD